MIVTCPSCDTRYRAEDDALSARGGRVRCASCGHSWKVEAEALTLSEAVDVPAVEETPLKAEPVSAPTLQARPLKPHELIRRRAEVRRRNARLAVSGVGWLGVAAMFAVMLGGAWIMRVDIMRVWPQSSAAFAAVGAPVNPYGLEVRNLSVAREETDGAPALAIEGDVVNITGRAREIPPLRAALLDADGAPLVEWVVLMESPELDAEAMERFRTIMPDPPEAAAEIEVIFDPDARPAGQAD
ncbi:DUF3426 domain-containing protein [Marinicauda salina]|nr:DUF3426 domain-containing protein [Marinicauda salina]